MADLKHLAFGGHAPILAHMPRSPKSRPLSASRFNPAPGFADLWQELRRPRPYRWLFLAVSVLPVAVILGWALEQEYYAPLEPPKITYITMLADGRSDPEIQAENRANQEIKNLRAAEEARITGEKRKIYKALGAAAGMDVDEMERKADAERAAEEAAKAKQLEQSAAEPAPEPNSESAGQ